MKKSQMSVVGTILISGIVISIIIITYIWGRPLVQKSVDKARIDTILKRLEEIDSAITYVADTGGSRSIRFSLGEEAIRISPDDNSISFETSTVIPIIASLEWLPLNYHELPFKRDVLYSNTSGTAPVGCPWGGIPRNGSITIEGVEFNVTACNETTEYNYACIGHELSLITGSDCGRLNDDIYISEIDYTITVLKVNETGSEVFFLGEIVENVGILGMDPYGIIVGKTDVIAEVQRVTMKVKYRSLKDALGNLYSIVIQCDVDCFARGGTRTLHISRERLPEKGPGYIKTYVKLKLD
jgi:hypothetical protein